MSDKKRKSFVQKLCDSKINYYSDLFIVAMVVMWIADNVWETIIATAVTIASIVISAQTGTQYYDTSMWQSIGQNVVVPLASGGALWMIKNAVQHAIVNSRGGECEFDFPPIDVDE